MVKTLWSNFIAILKSLKNEILTLDKAIDSLADYKYHPPTQFNRIYSSEDDDPDSPFNLSSPELLTRKGRRVVHQ